VSGAVALARFVLKPGMRLLLRLSCLVCLASVLAAREAVPVRVQLDWIYNAQFAGLYQALEQGYFAAEGLEVELKEAPKSAGVVESVVTSTGIAFGVSESNVLLLECQKGRPVVALAPMFHSSPMGWMVLKQSGIRSAADFRGRKVGIHHDGEKVLAVALARAGLTLKDVVITEVGYDPRILLEGTVDLMQGYSLDENVALQVRAPGQSDFIHAKDHGYIARSQVVFATEATVASNPALVERFLSACRRGWSYALENQESTVDLILRKWNPSLDRTYQIASLGQIARLVKPTPASTVMPLMSRQEWEECQSVFLKHDFLPQRVDLESFVYAPQSPR